MARRQKRKSRGWRRRLVGRLVAITGVLLVVVPATLTLAYRVLPPPITPLMVVRLIEGEGLDRRWVRMEAIAPELRFAVIAAEDNLFCRHRGFDLDSIQDAWREFRAGTRLRGASTISMQTARNLYLWPARTMLRKSVEAYLTLYLEALLPKQRILELYLNIAEWGPGIYGAEAAAQYHFGKSASTLTRREATLLAAVLPAPRSWSPSRPGSYVERRSATLQTRINQLGPFLDCAR